MPLARPEQRAILEQLPKKLNLDGIVTVEAVRARLEKAERDLNRVNSELNSFATAAASTTERLKKDLYELWPELTFGFSPAAAELTGERSQKLVAASEKLGSYKAHQAALKRQEELADKLLAAQTEEARAQRLLRAIESALLADNLKKSAPGAIVERYKMLIEMEAEGLKAAQ